VGPPGELYGPFDKPKQKPMKHALGISPEHRDSIRSSEICASCHTVHLPVLHRGRVITRVYEQATYPEWAFSAYRTGTTPEGPLPFGPGDRAESCQGCHMPSKDGGGHAFRSKIASIQELSNFPQAENTLPREDIDLTEREGFGLHTLVGLNLFLVKMAQDFPAVLGMRKDDPMLTARRGIDSFVTTAKAIVDQAATRTAEVAISDVVRADGALSAKVTITNKSGHKFPSGVAFRRAFIEFNVLNAGGGVMWTSGRTNAAGVIVDQSGAPIDGELWWTPDCSSRISPDARRHQPHYEVIARQNQAQIYEELVAQPADVPAPVCGAHAKAEGPLTTSFLSICARVKDNRLLPHGFLPLPQREAIAAALGADRDLAEDAGPAAVGNDPDYGDGSGGDSVTYRIPLQELPAAPAAVRATLYYQATPPYFLQDRFCTASGDDTQRLRYLVGKLPVNGTPLQDWKLKVGDSRQVPVR
jgi:hypothetical protein